MASGSKDGIEFVVEGSLPHDISHLPFATGAELLLTELHLETLDNFALEFFVGRLLGHDINAELANVLPTRLLQCWVEAIVFALFHHSAENECSTLLVQASFIAVLLKFAILVKYLRLSMEGKWDKCCVCTHFVVAVHV